MLKSIGVALAVFVAALSLAAPAQARTVPAAEHIVTAAHDWSVWHKPGHGYLVKQINAPLIDVPARPKEIRACGGGDVCRELAIAFYGSLHHTWLSVNRSLWVLHAAFPACSETVLDDCMGVPKGDYGTVTFDGVGYEIWQVPAART